MMEIPFEPLRIFAFFFALIGFTIIVRAYQRNKDLLNLFLAYLFLMIGAAMAVFENVYISKFSLLFRHAIGIMLPGFFLAAVAFKVSQVKE